MDHPTEGWERPPAGPRCEGAPASHVATHAADPVPAPPPLGGGPGGGPPGRGRGRGRGGRGRGRGGLHGEPWGPFALARIFNHGVCIGWGATCRRHFDIANPALACKKQIVFGVHAPLDDFQCRNRLKHKSWKGFRSEQICVVRTTKMAALPEDLPRVRFWMDFGSHLGDIWNSKSNSDGTRGRVLGSICLQD